MRRTQYGLMTNCCFALYAAANSVIRAYRPLLRDIGLTYPQYLTLMVLWLGHLSRARDDGDARVVRTRLTPLGADLEREAAPVQRNVVCRTGLDELSLAALRRQLQHLANDMHAPAACDDSTEGEAS